MKTAFYPCCNRDVEEPPRILANEVQRIIFCDINPSYEQYWRRSAITKLEGDLPATEFIVADAVAALPRVEVIDVLFYRRDSGGEGGSGVFVLGDAFLRPLLMRFTPTGGLIITDGSNSRGGNFKRMIKRSGMTKHGWKFSASTEQPYQAQHGLWRIAVVPVTGNEA